MSMNTVADELDLISTVSDLDRARVGLAFTQFRDKNGGDNYAAVRATKWLIDQAGGDPLRARRRTAPPNPPARRRPRAADPPEGVRRLPSR